MSEVTIKVGGRPYTLSCADGQEDHVRRLAAVVDGKLSALGENLAPGDTKNLLFTALILADELEEARLADCGSPASGPSDHVVYGLEAVAERMETLAEKLENRRTNA